MRPVVVARTGAFPNLHRYRVRCSSCSRDFLPGSVVRGRWTVVGQMLQLFTGLPFASRWCGVGGRLSVRCSSCSPDLLRVERAVGLDQMLQLFTGFPSWPRWWSIGDRRWAIVVQMLQLFTGFPSSWSALVVGARGARSGGRSFGGRLGFQMLQLFTEVPLVRAGRRGLLRESVRVLAGSTGARVVVTTSREPGWPGAGASSCPGTCSTTHRLRHRERGFHCHARSSNTPRHSSHPTRSGSVHSGPLGWLEQDFVRFVRWHAPAPTADAPSNMP
jgi:hypothetical protein